LKRRKKKHTKYKENQKPNELKKEQKTELDIDQPQSSEAPKEKTKQPKKLKEADFDDDGLISIEDFEEIEAQQLGAKFRAGLEKSRENFQEQLNNLIAS